MAKQFVWLGRDWTPHVQTIGTVLLLGLGITGVAGVSYLVGWGVEETKADPFVGMTENKNGTFRHQIPQDLVGSVADRVYSGMVVGAVALVALMIGYAARPRKVEVEA